MEVNGRHVAMAPTRDAIMITGTEDEEGPRTMAELAEEAMGDEYPLTAGPLLFEDDWWVDWMRPEGHPLRQTFRELQLKWLGPVYEEQKTLIDSLNEKRGEDSFVATFSAMDRGDGTESYCVWGEGV